jgi:hypothetical protein
MLNRINDLDREINELNKIQAFVADDEGWHSSRAA